MANAETIPWTEVMTGSSVSIVTKLREQPEVDSRQEQGKDSSSSSPRPDRFCGLRSLLPYEYRKLFTLE
jgi:hypothetical protein